MFTDLVEIRCKSGNGGNGLVSFHREKYVQYGGPDGGDGGRGGSVYFEADPSLNTLLPFRYVKVYRADNGEGGGQKNMFGRSGGDITIKVPKGTVIKDTETGKIIADVFEYGEKILILEGGKGGRGNARFATPTRRSPGFSELGENTEERRITLELKTIADVGLVGFPNVGKSSLLSVISAARPKIANYHFTTLTPNLGVTEADGYSFTVADIPGLIEGAAEGLGLGHSFLRHIERVRLIVHLVDISGTEGRNPYEDYIKIRAELASYSKGLAELPEIIAANKCDLIESDAPVKELAEKTGKEVVAISAVTTDGILTLKRKMAAILKTLPELKPLEFEPFKPEKKDLTAFTVTREKGGFRLSGGMLEDLARRVVLSDTDSFLWFQRVLRDKGVIDELRKEGVKDGETVRILDIEFEYLE